MAYGEIEAIHPTTEQRLDGTHAARPDVLCAIPVSAPRRGAGATNSPMDAPVQRFHPPRTSLDRPSTDVLMARLPGPASGWRAPQQASMGQQELDLEFPSPPPFSRPMLGVHVTSPALTHIGSVAATPRVTFHTHPNGAGQDEHLGTWESAIRPHATDLVSRVMMIVLALLVAAAVLPTEAEGQLVPPWIALFRPGSTPFTVGAFGALLAAMAFGPLDRAVRAGLSSFLGVGLLVFGFMLLGAEVSTGAFVGHPAMSAIFGGPLAGRVVFALCICTLPTALAWRSLDPASTGAKALLATGIALLVYGLTALQAVGIGSVAPWRLLLDSAMGSLFLGDRIAAILALGPGIVGLFALPLSFKAYPSSATVLAGLYWTSLVSPLFVLAVFASTASSWTAVLGPLQAVTTLAAGLLLLPMALGELLVVLGREPEPKL
jgi:hypothetical protein